MNALLRKPDPKQEFLTSERCWILESWNDSSDPAVSIARARITPGVMTQKHRLRGTGERYLITAGRGVVHIGSRGPEKVSVGDVVVIPEGVPQHIANDGDTDLVFYCICTPRFSPEVYETIE
jgi:mannose-6-phosphate isomerase-like protein (cupin superfamily)